MEKKEDIAAFKDYQDDGSAAPSTKKAAAPEEKPAPAPKAEKKEAPKKEEPTTTTSKPAPAPKGDRVFASPLARKIAKEKNVDLSVRIFFLSSTIEIIHLISVSGRYRAQWSNHCS